MRRSRYTTAGSSDKQGRRYRMKSVILRPITDLNTTWYNTAVENVNETSTYLGYYDALNTWAGKGDSGTQLSYKLQPLYKTLREIYEFNINFAIITVNDANVNVSATINGVNYLNSDDNVYIHYANTGNTWKQMKFSNRGAVSMQKLKYHDFNNVQLNFIPGTTDNTNYVRIYTMYMELVGI